MSDESMREEKGEMDVPFDTSRSCSPSRKAVILPTSHRAKLLKSTNRQSFDNRDRVRVQAQGTRVYHRKLLKEAKKSARYQVSPKGKVFTVCSF